MTTVLGLCDVLDRPVGSSMRDSRSILDNFWSAVHLESPEIDISIDHDINSDHEIEDDGPPYGYGDGKALDIFYQSASTPVIDIRGFDYRGLQGAGSPPDTPYRPSFLLPLITCGPGDGTQPFTEPEFVSPIGIPTPLPGWFATSAGPGVTRLKQRMPAPSKTPISDYLRRQTSRAPSPATSLLAMASTFLDSIVKLTQTESSTPSKTLAVRGEGDIQIMESEVFVNVIEDGRRAGLIGSLELMHEDMLPQKLDIPALSTLEVAGADYMMPSPYGVSTDGLAGCAEELDALSRMVWERQLINFQHSAWH